ncbi:MAG: type II toxin-antitoxin system Phd/YefM family antitoxin [Gammaproteobacteria bacterium]|nr:type II toxin-antitoxin system Phd/YefM family antitoxin [Gammaproteobacteria bacterium]
MSQVNMHDAKTHLSSLIEKAVNGEEVVIARAGKPMVRLVPVDQAATGRSFGAMKGKARVDERFFEPLPEDELAAWE